jgi:hypothetical protein
MIWCSLIIIPHISREVVLLHYYFINPISMVILLSWPLDDDVYQIRKKQEIFNGVQKCHDIKLEGTKYFFISDNKTSIRRHIKCSRHEGDSSTQFISFNCSYFSIFVSALLNNSLRLQSISSCIGNDDKIAFIPSIISTSTHGLYSTQCNLMYKIMCLENENKLYFPIGYYRVTVVKLSEW